MAAEPADGAEGSPQRNGGAPAADGSARLCAALAVAAEALAGGIPPEEAARLLYCEMRSAGLGPFAAGELEAREPDGCGQLALLAEVSRLLSSVESSGQLFDVLLTQLLEPLRLTNLEFYFLDEADGLLHRQLCRVLREVHDPGPDTLGPERGIVGRCLRTQSEQIVNDTAGDPDFFDPVPGTVRSQAAFPLFVSSRLVGVMNLECAERNQFGPDMAALLRALAPQVAVVVERLRLMDGLRERERMLRNAFDNIPGTYYRCRNDPDWTMLIVSGGCLDLTGYPPEDLLEGRVSFGEELILPEYRQPVWDAVQQALAEKRQFVLQYEIAARDGRRKWVWERGNGVFDSAGGLLALEGLITDITEQMRTQSELIAAEQRYRHLFETMGEGLVIIDHVEESRFAVANPAAESLFGVGPGGLVGRRLLDFCDPAGAVLLSEQLERRRHGQISRYEMEVLRPDGGRRRIQVTASPRTDAEGRLTGSFSLLLDVTEAAAAKEQIRLSEERYRALVHNLPHCAIVLVDRDLRFVLADGPEIENTGYSKAALEGRTVAEALPPDFAAVAEGNIRRVFAGESFSAEIPFGNLHFAYAYVPIRGAGGEVELALVLARNITEWKEAEAELLSSRRHLQTLIDTTHDAIIVITDQGQVETFNRTAEDLLGWSAEEIQGCDVSLIMSVEGAKRHSAALEDYLAGGETSEILCNSKEVTALRKDGSRVMVELAVREFEIGGQRRFLGMLRDISARKTAEARERRDRARLQQAQKLESLGLLAGGVAHDFNNLLVGILGNAGLALEDAAPGTEVESRLRAIETAARRAAELANQMLAYSGRGRFVIELLDFSALVAEMGGLLRAAASKRVTLEFSLDHTLPPLRGDATQLRQVVMNLITNAVEAADRAGGIVQVSTCLRNLPAGWGEAYLGQPDLPAGAYLCLDVVDNGNGMDARTLARVFDPFFTTRGTGRGLGLSVVQGIVQSHQGAIRVESHPGEGSRFRIVLPGAPEGYAVRQPPPVVHSRARLCGRILLVDDEETVLSVSRTILERAGAEVAAFDDSSAALRAFAADPAGYCCLVLDLTMPGLSGDELLAKARALRPEIGAILMSGYSEAEIDQGPEGPGVVQFVQKPFTPALLVDAVRLVSACLAPVEADGAVY